MSQLSSDINGDTKLLSGWDTEERGSLFGLSGERRVEESSEQIGINRLVLPLRLRDRLARSSRTMIGSE